MHTLYTGVSGSANGPDGLSEHAQHLLFSKLFATQYEKMNGCAVRALYNQWGKHSNSSSHSEAALLKLEEWRLKYIHPTLAITDVGELDSDPEEMSEPESESEREEKSDDGLDQEEKVECDIHELDSDLLQLSSFDNTTDRYQSLQRERSRSWTAHMVFERNNKPKRRIRRTVSSAAVGSDDLVQITPVVILDKPKQLGGVSKACGNPILGSPHPLRKVQSAHDLSPSEKSDCSTTRDHHSEQDSSRSDKSETSVGSGKHSTSNSGSPEILRGKSRREKRPSLSTTESRRTIFNLRLPKNREHHEDQEQHGQHYPGRKLKGLSHKLKGFMKRHSSLT